MCVWNRKSSSIHRIDPQPGFESLLGDIAGDMRKHSAGDAGIDFYRIRPYILDESARHVDWRATAHTGDLQIREYTRDQDPAVTIFLDLEIDDSDWFEIAVDLLRFPGLASGRERRAYSFHDPKMDARRCRRVRYPEISGRGGSKSRLETCDP